MENSKIKKETEIPLDKVTAEAQQKLFDLTITRTHSHGIDQATAKDLKSAQAGWIKKKIYYYYTTYY